MTNLGNQSHFLLRYLLTGTMGLLFSISSFPLLRVHSVSPVWAGLDYECEGGRKDQRVRALLCQLCFLQAPPLQSQPAPTPTSYCWSHSWLAPPSGTAGHTDCGSPAEIQHHRLHCSTAHQL